jgi:hypothetical protein
MTGKKVRVNGRPRRTSVADTISQQELRTIAELELIGWRTMRQVHKAISELEKRVAAGARIEPGPLAYSEDVGAVLSRGEGECLTVLSTRLADSVLPPRRKKS